MNKKDFKKFGKVSVPKGYFAFVKNGTVYGFKPKNRKVKK
jgi:hypothetical protein